MKTATKPTATSGLQCPTCHGNVIRRSHRTNLGEHFASFVGRYPYRCRACHARFTLFVTGKRSKPGEESPRRAERVKNDKKRSARLILLFLGSLAIFLVLLWKFILPPSEV